MSSKSDIVLIGSGNVATHLGMQLFRKGYTIRQVYSNKIKNAETLAKKLNCNSAIDDFDSIDQKAVIYIVAIKDDILKSSKFKLQLIRKNQLLIHTSGSVEMDVLKSHAINYGVLYPLQTFSKTRKVNFSNIPVCIEASNKYSKGIIEKIASDLSNSVHHIDSKKRMVLHVAAVFACNFSNFMYAIADDILEKEQISFDLIRPLIIETAQKVLAHKPLQMQTGPAMRDDSRIMKKHLSYLKKNESYLKIYQMLSDEISMLYKNQ